MSKWSSSSTQKNVTGDLPYSRKNWRFGSPTSQPLNILQCGYTYGHIIVPHSQINNIIFVTSIWDQIAKFNSCQYSLARHTLRWKRAMWTGSCSNLGVTNHLNLLLSIAIPAAHAGIASPTWFAVACDVFHNNYIEFGWNNSLYTVTRPSLLRLKGVACEIMVYYDYQHVYVQLNCVGRCMFDSVITGIHRCTCSYISHNTFVPSCGLHRGCGIPGIKLIEVWVFLACTWSKFWWQNYLIPLLNIIIWRNKI